MAGQEYAEMSVSADLIIHNGRVIDPETGRDEIASVAIKDGVITKITSGAGIPPGTAKHTIDAAGKVVSPGFISTHTHEAAVTDVAENIKSPSNLSVFDGVTFCLGGNCGMSPTGIRVDAGEGNVIQSGNPDRPLPEFLDELDGIQLYNHFTTLSGNITLRSRMGLKHMQK